MKSLQLHINISPDLYTKDPESSVLEKKLFLKVLR